MKWFNIIFLTLWHPAAFEDFQKKALKHTYMALRGNFSAPLQVTDLIKASKTWPFSLYLKKMFLLGGADFL